MIWGCDADLTKSRVHYLGYSLFKEAKGHKEECRQIREQLDKAVSKAINEW